MNLWPEIITADFWTFAVKYTIWLHNMRPIAGHNSKCPYELFTREMPPHHLSYFCVFGCPVYILEKNLMDNNGIPKWKLNLTMESILDTPNNMLVMLCLCRTLSQNWYHLNTMSFSMKSSPWFHQQHIQTMSTLTLPSKSSFPLTHGGKLWLIQHNHWTWHWALLFW